MLNKFLSYLNENNLQITWFFLGFLLCDLFIKIGHRDWTEVIWNTILIVCLYVTRKKRVI